MDGIHRAGSPERNENLALSVLEPDQLTGSKKHFPRLKVRGGKLLILWLLRIYALAMIAIVIYQIFTTPSH